MKIKNNKKGDIPITVLVIGIILICCIAIFSFSYSVIKMRNSFVGLGVMKEMNSKIEKNVFDGIEPAGIFFEKKITKGILWWRREITLFSAEYKFRP